LLKVAIEQEGNQTAFAKRHGINRTLLNEVANGKRHASGPILKALGLRKVYALDQNK
jgi:DNA-binding transcriptional regulator YdaS (Cro superfamily)